MAINMNNTMPQGSGFTNLQKYVNANQNNQLGSTINQGIGQVGNNVKSSLDQSQNQFQQDKSTELQKFDPSKIKAGIQAAQNVTTPTIVNADGTTSNNTVDPSIKSDFQYAAAGQYGGPSQLNNYDVLQGQAQDAQNLGNQVSSAGGREALLQRFVGGPGQYTQGNQRFDSLLLGQTGGKDLQQARGQVAGLGQNVNTAESVAAGQAQAAQGVADQSKQYATDQVNQAYSGVIDPLQQQADQQTAARQAQIDSSEAVRKKIQDYMTRSQAAQQGTLNPVTGKYEGGTNLDTSDLFTGSNGLTADDLKAVGINPDNTLANGLDVGTLLSSITNYDDANVAKNAATVNTGQLATDSDRARLAALNDLSGIAAPVLNGSGAVSDLSLYDTTGVQNALNNTSYQSLAQQRQNAITQNQNLSARSKYIQGAQDLYNNYRSQTAAIQQQQAIDSYNGNANGINQANQQLAALDSQYNQQLQDYDKNADNPNGTIDQGLGVNGGGATNIMDYVRAQVDANLRSGYNNNGSAALNQFLNSYNNQVNQNTSDLGSKYATIADLLKKNAVTTQGDDQGK